MSGDAGQLATWLVAWLGALPALVLAGGLVTFAAGTPTMRRPPQPNPQPNPQPSAEPETVDDDAGAPPEVSIVVPARDEAEVIERCVRSALAQRGVRCEVLVVDDGSTDGTGEILARLAEASPRLQVLEGRPLPAGWFGKPNALDVAVRRARGRILLFIDADTEITSGAVAAARDEFEARGAKLLTVWPLQRTDPGWVRRAQAPVIGLFAFANAAQRLAAPPFPEALMVWGMFLMVDAETYRELGGHAHPSVRGSIGEDYRLLQLFRDAGYRCLALDGTRQVAVRMYGSLAALWEGWTKNMFPGLERSLPLTVGASVLIVGATWLPWALGLAWTLRPSLATGSAALAALGALLMGSRALGRYVEGPPRALLGPLGGALAGAIFVGSAYLHLSGRGVTWKGRRYDAADEGGSEPER